MAVACWIVRSRIEILPSGIVTDVHDLGPLVHISCFISSFLSFSSFLFFLRQGEGTLVSSTVVGMALSGPALLPNSLCLAKNHYIMFLKLTPRAIPLFGQSSF